ncbi:MAG: helix-turn-helix domain-containing protein [Spirochaetales bacterium]|nr:helix-turn-helix domain-containing protein [Spirochaetales bacterium]
MQTFGNVLKNLRHAQKLTQKKLGDALGLGQTTIANYEQGARFPDKKQLLRIADHFQVSLDYLMGRKGEGTLFNQPDSNNQPAPKTDELLSGFFDNLKEGNISEARRMIVESVDRGLEVHTLYSQVFVPLLYRVGDLWENEKMDIYTEHIITNTVRDIMATIRTRAPRAPAKRLRFLALSAGGELHDLGLQMICDFLYFSGWETLFLGTYLPSQESLKAIHKFLPQMIGISITLESHVESARDLIRFLRHHVPAEYSPTIIVGGQAILGNPELADQLGADFVALSHEDAVEIAEDFAKNRYNHK